MTEAKYKPISTAVGTVVTTDDDDDDDTTATTKTTPSLSCSSLPAPRSSRSRPRFVVVRSLCKFLLLLLLACMVVSAVLLGIAFHGGRHLLHRAGSYVIPRITSDRPRDLPPPIHLTPEEATDIHDRIVEFRRALHDGTEPARDLELTEREMNGLACLDEDLFGEDHHHRHHHRRRHHHHDGRGHGRHRDGGMCGMVHVTVSRHRLVADFSVPLDDSVVPGGEGRYIVGSKFLSLVPSEEMASSLAYEVRGAILVGGTATAAVDRNDNDDDDDDDDDAAAFHIVDVTGTMTVLDDGSLDVRARSAELMGWIASDEFLGRFLEGWNLATLFSGCPHHAQRKADVLKRIGGVDIGGGKVVIKLRRGERGGGEGEAAATIVAEEEHKEKNDDEEVEVDIGMRNLLRVAK